LAAPPSPTVSVVIPCYNAAATIGATIDSALGQDGVTLEVIVVDDGSSDASAEVLAAYGDRITAVFGPNRGASAARNTGASRARGAWFVFLDADDLLVPGTLSQRLETVARTGATTVICDWEDFDDGREDVLRPRQIDVESLLREPQTAIARGAWAPPAAVLYSRAVVEGIGGFREDLPVIQDARYLFDAAYNGAVFAHDPHPGARYRVLPGSLSRRSPARFWSDVLRNGQQIEALWRKAGGPDADQRQVLIEIYDYAARGLFTAGEPAFAEAVAGQKILGGGTRYTLAADRLSRLIGQANARRALSLVTRG
jgi:glycosyltransferase involved in cell wall biosynthesis